MFEVLQHLKKSSYEFVLPHHIMNPHSLFLDLIKLHICKIEINESIN